MELKTQKRLYTLLPWGITLVLLGAITVYSVLYKPAYNPFLLQPIKIELVSRMRINLLEANEAEKNAVLAITDEESEAYATKARQAADRVEISRKEVESIIHSEQFPREIKMINEFNACWLHYRKLDEIILTLSVQNTNLKAQKISLTQGAQEIRTLEESLNSIIRQHPSANECDETVIPAYVALTAGFKIFALHKPHIEEADDNQMDKIEQNIKSYNESAQKALNTLSSMAALSNNPDLQKAQTAYDRFMKLTGKVLRLSRMNTNIKSATLSLGKKRLISAQCQEILTNLNNAVRTQSNYSLPRLKNRGLINSD
jgi:hypothetical protein